MNKIIKTKNKTKKSFGEAEFKVVCTPRQVKLVIHQNHIVAKANKDVFEKIFDYAVKQLGGRIDDK